MTEFGLRLLEHREGVKHNRATEAETQRSHLMDEQNRRDNLDETIRSNLAREFENRRSNVAKETETHRSNLANEGLQESEITRKKARDDADVALGWAQRQLDSAKLDETRKQNVAKLYSDAYSTRAKQRSTPIGWFGAIADALEYALDPNSMLAYATRSEGTPLITEPATDISKVNAKQAQKRYNKYVFNATDPRRRIDATKRF